MNRRSRQGDLQPEVQELRDELAAANETIDALSQALAAASEARANTGNPDISPQLSEDGSVPNDGQVGLRTPQQREIITSLVRLAQNEFRHGRNEAAGAIARQILKRAPNESQSQRLLSLVSPLERPDGPPRQQRAHHHLALGEACRLLGEHEAAETNYRSALAYNHDLPDAHGGLAALRMPGHSYLYWLDRFYQLLKPKTVIEIGVCQSASLSHVPPPAIAIGIDPAPSVLYAVQTETHLFAETSDEFFKHRRAANLLGDQPLSVGFIDGLHLFEQALRDFMHLEAYCGPQSMVLFHDTIPLDELTQRRTPEVHFSTGDVWKTILCLNLYRADLDIFTIATPPTGLTVVIGLDPSSRVLEKVYDEAVARFIETPFSAVERDLPGELNIVPNDWETIQARLKARRIICEE